MTLGIARGASANVILVTTTTQSVNTDADCSLQEAIYAANFDASIAIDPANLNQTITTGCLPGAGADTIVLQTGAVYQVSGFVQDQFNPAGIAANPIVFTNITIEGNGARLERIGSLNIRAFVVGSAHIVDLGGDTNADFDSNGNLTIRNLHIRGFRTKGGDGASPGGGGGLGAGGAIFAGGPTIGGGTINLNVVNSTFEDNGATGGAGGSGTVGTAGGGGGGGGLGGNGGGITSQGGGGGGGARGAGGAGGDAGGGGGGTANDGVLGGAGNPSTGGNGGFNCGGKGGDYPNNPGDPGFCAGGGGGGGAGTGQAGGNGAFGGGGGGGSFGSSGEAGGNAGTSAFGGGGGGGGNSEAGNGGIGGNAGFGGGGGGGGRNGAGSFTNGGNAGYFGGPGTGGSDTGHGAGGGGAGLGGAIFSDGAIVNVSNSTFTANFAHGGSGGTLADGAGGAIFARNGELYVLNVTVNGNSVTGNLTLGGGIVVFSDVAAQFGLYNTIISNNGSFECYVNGPGAVATGGANNLITSNVNCPAVVAFTNPQLQPLALNSPGATPTMALASTSPAIDAADAATSLTSDQRGVARPQGAGFDIGAYEYRALPQVDLQVVKLCKPDDAFYLGSAGNPYCDIVVTNLGPVAAEGVKLTDFVTANGTYTITSLVLDPVLNDSCTANPVTGAPTSSPTTISCSLADDFGSGSTWTIRVNYSADAPVDINDTATVTSDNPDSNTNNNHSDGKVQIKTAPVDLQVTKLCKPDGLWYLGDTLAPYCDIVVTNLGTQAATTVNVTDHISGSANFIVASVTELTALGMVCTPMTPTAPAQTATVSCDLTPSLPPNASWKIRVTYGDAGVATDINDEAVVTSANPDSNTDNNTATGTVRIALPSADLAISKACTPDGPWYVDSATQPYCDITVTNFGPKVATGVTITDKVTASANYQITAIDADLADAYGGSPACTPNPALGVNTMSSTVSCTLGVNLPANATWTVRITFDADVTVDINDEATVTSTSTDPVTGNNKASDTLNVKGVADLTTRSTFTGEIQTNGLPGGPVSSPPGALPDAACCGTSSTTATAGRRAEWTMYAVNNGSSPADNVKIVVKLPANTQLLETTLTTNVASVDKTGSCLTSPAGDVRRTVTCSFGTLDPTKQVGVYLQVVIDPTVPKGTQLSFDGEAKSDTKDPNPVNNLQSKQFITDAWADLRIDKTDSPDPVYAGNPLVYDVRIDNDGPSTARGVTMTDTLPAGVTYTGYTVQNGSGTCSLLLGVTLSCNLNDLNPGQYVRVIINVTTSPSLANNSLLSNTAVAATNATLSPDPVGTDNTDTEPTTVLTLVDLSITKTASWDINNPAPRVTYTITLTNNGPSDAQGVYFVDRLPLDPKKVVYVFDTGNGACSYTRATHRVTCLYPSAGNVMPAKAVWSVNIIVDVKGATGIISNYVDGYTTTYEVIQANNTARKDVSISSRTGPNGKLR